ncbi:MAG: FTR1 family protein [Pelolinea sp.]|nr:FTR1 family protein [Pelolinea sp.]
MISSLLIALREGLEVALIIGIVLGYLDKVHAGRLKPVVWRGFFAGAASSLLIAGILFAIGVRLEGRAEALFEGFAMLAAAAMLTWVIFWLGKQNQYSEIQTRTEVALSQNRQAALFSLAYFAVVREGVELALFLLAAQISSGGVQTLVGAVTGLVTAFFAGWLTFKSVSRLDLRSFFRVTNILLIFFAAGLVGYGVHELNEAGILPTFIQEIWNINSILNDKSDAGLFLKALFGYNGNPSLSEAFAYGAYLLIAGLLVLKKNKKIRNT